MVRFVVALLALSFATPAHAAPDNPNIVLIYADDLGFGDITCNGAKPGLTPNIDNLRKHSLNFTDAHSSSATCTPSRYALLTGQYPWRRRGTGVLPGDARLIIEPGTTTLATVLKSRRLPHGRCGWQVRTSAWAATSSTGMQTSNPARAKSASMSASSWLPPATAFRASTSETIALSASTRPTQSKSAMTNPSPAAADRQNRSGSVASPPQPMRSRHGDR